MQDKWNIERDRVQRLASAAFEEIGSGPGDIEAFAQMLLAFSMQLNTTLHGPESLEAALSTIARGELVRLGRAAQC
jgi:hypothetical protein